MLSTQVKLSPQPGRDGLKQRVGLLKYSFSKYDSRWRMHSLAVCCLFLTTGLSELDPGACKDDVDCSLNGDCIGGVCACDAAWSGHPSCDVLAFDTPAQTRDLGYHNASGYSSWGGNAVLDDGDGLHHLFVAQFANHCELGDWGSTSLIVRAVSSTGPAGPFAWAQDVILPFAHNPTVRKLPSGAGYVLYMIGGTRNPQPKNCSNSSSTVAAATAAAAAVDDPLIGTSIRASFAPSVTGPWTTPVPINFTNHSPLLWRGGTNPSPHVHPDGSVTLAFQMQPQDSSKHWELVGVATASSWRGPFTLVSPDPVTPGGPLCVAGRDEDPFLWQSPRGYHIVTHGMCPTAVHQAHYKFSLDGITWVTSPRQTYPYRVDYADGGSTALLRVERPQLAFAVHDAATGTFSNATTLYNAVCEGLKCVIDGQTGHTHTWARVLKS